MSMSLATLLLKDIKAIEIVLVGVVSLADSSALHRTLKQILNQGPKTVMVDLKKVVDVDGSCWNYLVSAARQLRRQGGNVVLHHCPDGMYNELQLRRWDRCFLVPEHRPEDLAALPGELQGWLTQERSAA